MKPIVSKLKQSNFKKKRAKRPPRYAEPTKIEKQYIDIIIKEVRRYKKVVNEILIPLLPLIVKDYQEVNNIVFDGYVENLDAAQNLILLETTNERAILGFKEVAAKIGADISTYSLKQHTKVLKAALGVTPTVSEPWLATKAAEFTARNADLIKTLNTETTKEITQLVRNGLQTGLRHEQIKAQIIQKIGDGTVKLSPSKMSMVNRAKLIARDQTSKYYAELNSLRQKQLGIEKYIWQANIDERTRESHRALDGKICRWDDPTVYSEDGENWQPRTSSMFIGHPGEDYNCRCYSEPYFNDILKEL